MIKDTEALDYMFVHTFGGDTFDSCSDFPFIALDFLKHTYPNIEEYSKYVYADDCMDKWAPDTAMRYKVLNMILAAARHQNEYACEMLCRLYKVYYKREYNQLKRFREISYDELRSFENEEELFEQTAARILTICPFMGIEIRLDCELVIPDVEAILEDETFDFKVEPEEFRFDVDLFREAGEEARELIERKEKRKRDYFWRNDISKFKEQVFNYLCVPKDFDDTCDRELDSLERSIAITITLLKMRFRNRTFTDEEILYFHEIFRQIRAFSSQIGMFDEMVDMMIGRTDRFEFELEQCRYHPEKQKIATTALREKKDKTKSVVVASPTLQADASEREKELLLEINDLKVSLKQKQQEFNEIKRKYLEAKEEAAQNRIDDEQWKADRSELFRLREYVYSLTEEDARSTDFNLEEMKAALKDRKIIIVGGHENWVGYLKDIFPNWTYIKPSISNTLPESHAVHAEYLFFFTDTISHGSFNKYMNIVRKHGLPYSYLHGTNIDRTIINIYREVTG